MYVRAKLFRYRPWRRLGWWGIAPTHPRPRH